jgi:hypothetical protein
VNAERIDVSRHPGEGVSTEGIDQAIEQHTIAVRSVTGKTVTGTFGHDVRRGKDAGLRTVGRGAARSTDSTSVDGLASFGGHTPGGAEFSERCYGVSVSMMSSSSRSAS